MLFKNAHNLENEYRNTVPFAFQEEWRLAGAGGRGHEVLVKGTHLQSDDSALEMRRTALPLDLTMLYHVAESL